MDLPTSDIIKLWFGIDRFDPGQVAAKYSIWFRGGKRLDQDIAHRFGFLFSATPSPLEGFRHTARTIDEALALTIALDQFPRHIFRGTPHAFAFSSEAIELTRSILSRDDWALLSPIERVFTLMPLHHSESATDQTEGLLAVLRLSEQAEPPWQALLDGFLRSFRDHALIVEQFGRFPHRNQILGRPSTKAERLFLARKPQSFGQAYADRGSSRTSPLL